MTLLAVITVETGTVYEEGARGIFIGLKYD